ncbi:sulfite exporter TauE/SafE family protein [Streptomyces sp. NPDC046915]|uniref:sulfite exporter TauE/SafE family protein n=1 Tax=Streptomyces sp. NPDC046915 TaxID=3155257 RepID=UPI0033FA6D21
MPVLILALVAGAVVGLALGALGGGGGMLAVPSLVYLLGVPLSAATTAGLVVVALTAITALPLHARDGRVRWRTGLLFAMAGIPTALAGGAVAGRLPGDILTGGFAVIAAAAALRMLFPGGTRDGARPPRPARAVASGAGLGAITGVLGVGGGFLVVPALTSVLGLPMRDASGTSLLVISANSLAALATRTSTSGGLDWTLLAPFTAAALLGAWEGSRLAARTSGLVLRRIFAAVLLAVASFMIVAALI